MGGAVQPPKNAFAASPLPHPAIMSAPGSAASSPLPEAGHDPTDPNDLINADKDTPTPPLANPTADMDELSDNDSELSEVDEAQFEDFDPAALEIEERAPVEVDEDALKLIGRHKRKRDDAADGEGTKKKKKEGRREKPKKSRRRRDEDDAFSGGEEIEGKRTRKAGTADEASGKRERRRNRPVSPDNDDDLDPETRRLHSRLRHLWA